MLLEASTGIWLPGLLKRLRDFEPLTVPKFKARKSLDVSWQEPRVSGNFVLETIQWVRQTCEDSRWFEHVCPPHAWEAGLPSSHTPWRSYSLQIPEGLRCCNCGCGNGCNSEFGGNSRNIGIYWNTKSQDGFLTQFDSFWPPKFPGSLRWRHVDTKPIQTPCTAERKPWRQHRHEMSWAICFAWSCPCLSLSSKKINNQRQKKV